MIKSLIKAQELSRAGVLFAPASFKTATAEQLKSTCNGCGAAGSWFRPPHTIYGTEIIYACHIHDWMYSYGRVVEDKDEADRSMLNNMNRLIERQGGWLQKIKHWRAYKYYLAVHRFGGSAFWKGKS